MIEKPQLGNTPKTKKRVDLRKWFRPFTDFIMSVGANDRERAWKLRKSQRVIARLKYGRVPLAWLDLPPDGWRAWADALEELHDSGEYERVYRYIEKFKGEW